MKLNDRQRKFAQLVVSGMPAKRAYQEAGYSKRSAESLSSRLIRNDEVRAYIEELRQKTESETTLSLQEIREFLARALRTSADSVEANDPLIQKVKRTDKEVTLEIVSKMEAIEKECKLMGHYAPNKTELKADQTLLEALVNIRQGKDPDTT